MPDHPLSCMELVELITDYLEGALSHEAHRRFEDHLATCDGCTAYLSQMQQTIQLTGRLSVEAIPAEAKERLLDAFRAWKSG